MNREQHAPPRRQFIHPMSPIRDTLPVIASETLKSYPPSRSAEEEQTTLDQWGNGQIRAGWIEEKPIQPLSPHAFPVERQANIPVTRRSPTSFAWMMPQSEPDSAQFVADHPNAAFQQDERQLETGHDAALSWIFPPAPSRPVQGRGRRAVQKQPLQPQQRPKSRKRRIPIWMAVISIIAIVVIVLTQGNGIVGAWTADEFRAIAGPVVAAQVEALYLNAQNTAYRWEYQLGLHHVAAPFQGKSLVIKSARPAQTALKPMSLTAVQPLISPALNGEGTWTILEAAPGVYSYLPLDAKAFIRPDPTTSYAVVSLLQFDARFMRLHIVSGTKEPGGPLGAYGQGIIPQKDQEGNALLATLNGGFKYADGAFGLMTDGKVFVPPQQNAATIAITKSGKLIIGAWGTDPRLYSNNKDLVAWRQNAGLLINNGKISTLAKDGAAWGGTILNSEYTWRSGLGITAEGNLVYAAGNALVPETLGKALKAAGAVMAMETDINPFWTRAFLYQQEKSGALTISKLSTAMQGTGKEYLTANERDFFYLTRYMPVRATK